MACSPDAVEHVTSWDSLPDEGQRARTLQLGEVRWHPDGEVVGTGMYAPDEAELVVLDVGDRVGVQVLSPDLELMLYVDRADLRQVPWSRIGAAAEPGAHEVVSLPPGLDLDVIDVMDRSARVRWSGSTVRVDAWVRRADLDHTWETEETWDMLDDVEPILLPGDTPILDGPGGVPVAWTQPFTEEDPHVRWVRAVLGRAQGRYHEVSVAERGVVVDGWITGEALTIPVFGGKGAGMSSVGGGVSWTLAGPDDVLLPADTLLYDAPDGRVVGRTRHPVFDHPYTESVWTPWRLPSDWGELEVWLSPDAVDL
jgi:hypothetical protein